MKNRLIITVSDVRGTKAYNVHQIIKKLFLVVVFTILLIFVGGFWFINYLNEQMEDFRKNKEVERKVLINNEIKLKKQNKVYSIEVKNKIKDIETLSSKLDHMEEILGLKNKEETKESITEETLKNLNDSMRNYMLKIIPNGMPLEHIKITSNFGYRHHPIQKKRKFHRGLDLKAKMNTPVFATADGVVSYVQAKNIGDFGRIIKINHNYGFQTIYAHLNKTKVRMGDVIRKNDKIGLAGSSGRSTAPHLHYEVRYAGKILNPKDYMFWNLSNYETIFKKQRRVKWESLVKLINEQFKMVLQ